MFPVPTKGCPMAALVLVQLKISPPPVLALKLIAEIASPEHTTIFETELTTGSGLIVIVNVLTFVPPLVQPFFVADTVIIPTILEPVRLMGAV